MSRRQKIMAATATTTAPTKSMDGFLCRSSAGEFDPDKYRKCVEACALERDFGEWAEGDETVIGAKGAGNYTELCGVIFSTVWKLLPLL